MTETYTYHCKQGGENALAVLTALSSLPKMRLKDAMSKGAVWLKREGKGNKRVRRATLELQVSDELSLHYNAEILALTPPTPKLVTDERQYSVWNKPPGLLAQGTLEGDHCSLLRIVEQQLQRDVFLVHRLDREAEGLMLIAHTGKAAAALSALFAQETKQGIRKIYRVEVRGIVESEGEINAALDGKTALTRYKLLEYSPEQDSSLVEVELVTGRKHQIRRHFAGIGHAVLGDPQYGSDNKDKRGLQLRAVALEFVCPLSKQLRSYAIS